VTRLQRYALKHQQELQRATSRALAEAGLTLGASAAASPTSGPATAAAGAASSVEDVMRQLLEAELFHTTWKSRRPETEASPPYDGTLVEQLVRDFTGLTMSMRSAAGA
jgi:hypothetical protein